MSWSTTSSVRCAACGVRARVRYDEETVGLLRFELEHMDDDLHNIVPYNSQGARGVSALLLDPDIEQIVPFVEPP